MNFNYKKIASIFGGVLMLGGTIAAGTSGLPGSFIQGTQEDVTAVYGDGAHANDIAAATSIGNLVTSTIIDNAPTGKGDYSGAEGVEEGVILSGSIVSGKILDVLTDNKIPALLDGKINWDDGESSDSTFNFHEAILIDDVNLATSLDDNDFDGVALTNNKGLAYRFVFEENMTTSLIGDNDAEELYLSILGTEYEIDAMDSDSITVVTSEEVVLNEGETFTKDGETFTVSAIGEDSISINGVILDEGRTKRVGEMKVQLDSIFYTSEGRSFVVVNIGKDITTEYNSGDEFIGEDDDDPEWIWDINEPGKKDGYIGVVYNHKNTRAKDDGVIYEGEAYEFPNSYVAVQFNGLTDVSYENFDISFDDDKDLWNATSRSSVHSDVPVMVIEGPTDESIVVNGKETDTIYVRYATNTTGTEANVNETNGAIEVFYEDVNKDVSDSIRSRYIAKYALDANHDRASIKIAELVVDDTIVDIKIQVDGGKATLIFSNDVSETSISVGGDTLTDTAGTFEHLGVTSEDAESGDILIDGNTIGTEDNDVMDSYGMIIQSPEGNADDDRVVLSIPSEQVEAKISVVGQGVEIADTVPEGADFITKDTNVETIADNNLIVVGGSCINEVAQVLLDESEPLCGTDFTEKTGVGPGQYLIEVFRSPYNSDKVAVLVAGYEKEDTTRGVAELLSGEAGIDMTIIGEKVIA